jgi:hypothetical protein
MDYYCYKLNLPQSGTLFVAKSVVTYNHGPGGAS